MVTKSPLLIAAALLLVTTAAFAQPASSIDSPGPTAVAPPSDKSSRDKSGDSSYPDSASPESVKPTSEIGRFGNFVPSPSTGSDDSSPAPVPGSPPTAPR